MSKQTDFIDKIAPYAIEAAEAYGFPYPSVCIAQACHESGFGTSSLAKDGIWNFFGIKLNNKGISEKYVVGNATEEVNGKDVTTSGTKWAAFNSVSDGVYGYFRYLTVWKHYNVVFSMQGKGYEAVARQIAKTYATRSNYGDKIVAMIKQYNLTKYDAKMEHFVPMMNWSSLKKGDIINTYKEYKVAMSESKARNGIYATNKDGSYKVYPVGQYYVYKVSNGCVNISKSKLLPGGWIFP